MSLVEYKRKRSFAKTPEPTGGRSRNAKLHFVVQKHAASHLHYDFRLEMDGVLKSWAIPKGPSMKPSDKRLAMLVEDHPFDYKDFEGIIPEGNYGAGTVIIWDQGTYESLESAKGIKEHEKILKKGFYSGSLKFRLHGKKLKGEFVLVKTQGRAENAWLLIKHRDSYAMDSDIGEKNKSVVSGKTLEEMAEDIDADVWSSNRTAAVKRKGSSKPPIKKKLLTKRPSPEQKAGDQDAGRLRIASVLRNLSKSRKSPIPLDLEPMLATLADKPVDATGWIHEIKWDGFRSLSYLSDGNVEIRSRNNKNFDDKFYPLYQALTDWNVSAVVDGEIVVINEKGFPDFGALQTWRSEADGQLVYYLFDLLWLDGYDLMSLPLAERRNILQHIVPASGPVRLSENFDVSGAELLALAEKMGLEGIVAKKADSKYQPGQRAKDWLKIKTVKQQEVVIGGYTRNENSSKLLSALLVGVFQDGELVFTGPVGTGFTNEAQKEILKKLKPLETGKCPFREVPDYNKPSRFRPKPPKAEVVWVRPKIVAEVNYRTRASDGTFRHPSFKGLRDDKVAQEVVWEEPVQAERIEHAGESRPIVAPPSGNERKTLLNPSDETQVRNIGGHELKFTNLSKVFWPEINVSKRDLLNYYYQVVPYMLPYMKDRPQTLNRFPNGIHGKSFYQKDVTGKVPSWIQTHQYYSESDGREKNFLVCTDEASLLYIASLGCIEMNPWSSRTDKPDNPDWCIIDLDPDKNSFDQVIETARVTKQVLEGMSVPGYPKTSGSTGLHIYIPLGAKYTYEESKEFGRAIATAVQKELPAFTSIERLTSNRKGKIYVDFLQNRPQATVAGPYSLRPKPGAPVSMPLMWEEVKKGMKVTDFHIGNAIQRLKERGDLFSGVLGKAVDMAKALKKLDSL
jgi:bifunctional non-homologous end joining protein LigD